MIANQIRNSFRGLRLKLNMTSLQNGSYKGNWCSLLSKQNIMETEERNSLKRTFSNLDLEEITTDKIRNVAMIAHVDHGKTTLVDCLLKDAGFMHSEDRIMDTIDLEQEKGITIM